eukprot:g1959.t1
MACGPAEVISQLKGSFAARLKQVSPAAQEAFDEYDTQQEWDVVWRETSITSGMQAFSLAKPYFPKGQVVLPLLEEVYKLVKDQNIPGKFCITTTPSELTAVTQTIHEALRKVSGNEGITIEKDEYDADHGQVIRKTSITTGAMAFGTSYFPRKDTRRTEQSELLQVLKQLLDDKRGDSTSSWNSRKGPAPGLKWRGGTPPQPPKWQYASTDLRAFAKYERRVQVWQMQVQHYLTGAEAGLMLFSSLSGEPEAEAEHMELEKINAKDGVAYILSCLKGPLEQKLLYQKRMLLSNYENIARQGHETVRQFINRCKRVERDLQSVGISSATMYDAESRGNRILERCKLDPSLQRLVLIGAQCNLDFDSIVESLQLQFPDFRPTPAVFLSGGWRQNNSSHRPYTPRQAESILAITRSMGAKGWKLEACPMFGGMGASWPTFVWHQTGQVMETAIVAIKDQSYPGKVVLGGVEKDVAKKLMDCFAVMSGPQVENKNDSYDQDDYDLAFRHTKMTSGKAICSLQNSWWPYGYPMEVILGELMQRGWEPAGGPAFGSMQLSWPAVILQREKPTAFAIAADRGSPSADATPMRLDGWLYKHVCSSWDARQKLISSKQDFIYFPKTMSPVPKRREPLASGQLDHLLLHRVIYKDTDFIAIDKPIGWTVNPGKKVGNLHLQRLLPTLQFGMEELPVPPSSGHVRDEGINDDSLGGLGDMIAQRAFWQRDFWALVCGRTPKTGQVSMPLAQERLGQRNVAKPVREDDGGLPAMTEYNALRFSPLCGGLTLLSMNPYSGRYHQTRAHCAFGLRAPMLGDPIYYELSNVVGGPASDFKVRYHSAENRHERKELLGPSPRLHLHSRQLMIKTFAGKEVVITAPVPEHFARSLNALGWEDWLRRAEHRGATQSTRASRGWTTWRASLAKPSTRRWRTTWTPRFPETGEPRRTWATSKKGGVEGPTGAVPARFVPRGSCRWGRADVAVLALLAAHGRRTPRGTRALPEGLERLQNSADHSWLRDLQAEPQQELHRPNREKRLVSSGHFVRVEPTPLLNTSLVAFSPSMAQVLGLQSSDCESQE